MKDKLKTGQTITPYTDGALHQFFFQDDILHLWVNERSGLYIIPLNEKEEMHFLADLDHKPKEGTVYEFKGIHKTRQDLEEVEDEVAKI